MIEIAQQHRDQILATPPSTTPEMILADVDDINEIMDQQDLLFRKARIAGVTQPSTPSLRLALR